MALLTRRNIGLAAGMAAAVTLTAGALIAFSVRPEPALAADEMTVETDGDRDRQVIPRPDLVDKQSPAR